MYKTILSIILVFSLCVSLKLDAQIKKKKQSNFKQTPQSKKEVSSQMFCFDDTYGSTGMKLQIKLFDDKTARLEFLQNGEVKRIGSGKWIERSGAEQGYGDATLIYLYLSTGTLQFSTMKNSAGRTYMLIDSRENQYMECF